MSADLVMTFVPLKITHSEVLFSSQVVLHFLSTLKKGSALSYLETIQVLEKLWEGSSRFTLECWNFMTTLAVDPKIQFTLKSLR